MGTAAARALRAGACFGAAAAIAMLLASTTISAQPQRGGGGAAPAPGGPQRGGGRGGPGAPAAPANARGQVQPGSLVDFTGYWVSVVTEDWRYRMLTAPKGEHPGLPLSAEGNRVANAWDPAKDEAAGEQCKAYGAAGVMRLPGRIHITWQDDNTLKIETEAGNQTRLLKFGAAPDASGPPTLQGVSVASWEVPGGRGRGRGGPAQFGDLKVVTTHMKAGYLQRNGVPYGENAVQTEYFNRANEPNGDSWLILTHIVEDPQYLNGAFVRSTHFKKLPDSAASQWSPEPCSAR
jgi:hypothetical protein